MAKLKKTKLTDPEHTGVEPAEEQIVTMPKTEAPAEENLEVITEDPPAPAFEPDLVSQSGMEPGLGWFDPVAPRPLSKAC